MKKCLIVLGMHRSGTSAMMGVLNTLGVEIGSNLMIPSPWNPKGNFELRDIYKLNEKILSSLDSSWDNPCLLPENWWMGSEFDEYKKEISRLIKNFDADLIGIKDPRLCRLFPLWNEVFKDLGIKPHFVIPLRHPLETAGSLKRRNNFPLEKSLLLWMVYILEAEFYSREFPRVFITYDSLFKDISNTINKISTKLDIKFPLNYKDAKEDIAQFLDYNLKHHNQDADPMDKTFSEEIFSCYRLLSLFAAEETTGEVDLLEIDKVMERHFDLNKMFYNRDIKNALTEKERTAAQKKSIIDSYESRLIYIP